MTNGSHDGVGLHGLERIEKTVYFVRHGEAQNNTKETGKYMGHTAALTEKGVRQAEMIAERAARLPAEVIVSSSWKRAADTAAIIAKHTGHAVVLSDLFIERRSPERLIGMDWTSEEMRKFEHEWVQTFYAQDARVEDGENFADIHERAKQALQFLIDRPESKILVATHGFFLRMLLAQIFFGDSLTPREFHHIVPALRTTNTGITVARFAHDEFHGSARWHLLAWNDHAHLG